MVYDEANRLLSESVESTGQPLKETLYTYDASGNRDSKVEKSGGVVQKDVDYGYNVANQLTSWEEKDGTGAVLRSATLGYDARGNRNTQTITPTGGTGATTTYAWTSENRLASVTLPDASVHSYTYDYRVRRINRTESGTTTAMTFAGGLSVAEYEVANATSSIQDPASSTVSYQRGPDMGGGVGGLLYSLRGSTPKFNLSNGRGDVVAQSDSTGALTWTASYEAYGKRPVETGANADRQRANTKEEDPTGLLNEGFRYRDIATGVWLSRDPAGFVDGPNLYAYARQNPWTSFDPEGLFEWKQYGSSLVNSAESALRYIDDGCGAFFYLATGGTVFGDHYQRFDQKSDALSNKLTHDADHLRRAAHHALGGSLSGVEHDLRAIVGGDTPEEQAANLTMMVAPPIISRASKAVRALAKGEREVPAPKLQGSPESTAQSNARHQATMTVLDNEGNPILTQQVESGGSGAGKKLSWPEQGKTHTEAKATHTVRGMVNEGQDVGGLLIEGQNPPCNMCKGEMNKLHTDTGVPSTYVDGDGKIFESTPKEQ